MSRSFFIGRFAIGIFPAADADNDRRARRTLQRALEPSPGRLLAATFSGTFDGRRIRSGFPDQGKSSQAARRADFLEWEPSQMPYALMQHAPHATFEQLTLAQLHFLEDLARTCKLSKTASNFGMSLASASLTLDKLRETLARAEHLFEPEAFSPAELGGRFRILSRGLATAEILAYVLPRIAKEAPGLRIEHRPLTHCVWEDLRDGVVDMALVTNRSVPPSCRSFPLFDIELGVVMRRTHPLALAYGCEAAPLSEIFSFPRVAMAVTEDRRSTYWDRQLFGEKRAQEGVVCASTSALELAATIAHSDIIMFAPKFGSAGIRTHYDLVWQPLPEEAGEQTQRFGVMVWDERQHRHPSNFFLNLKHL